MRRLFARLGFKWGVGWVEVPDQPDEPDELDAIDAPQGLLGDDLASGASSATGVFEKSLSGGFTGGLLSQPSVSVKISIQTTSVH